MSGEHFGSQPFPRGPLIGAALLVGASLLLAALGRYADIGRTTLPGGTAVAAYDLRFADRADGGVAVTDVAGRPVGLLAPGTNGFARGVMRGLARERKRMSLGHEAPFRLTRWTDGRLSLDDPQTGRRVNLEVFGPTNSEAFARLWRAADALHASPGPAGAAPARTASLDGPATAAR